MPGGVNSPVRAFRAVGCHPLVFAQGQGATIIDVDGNRYLDLVGSWGPLILGHAHPAVVRALQSAASNGVSFGATCPQEIELGRLIKRALPSIDLIRLVSSGTEAAMSAIRAARGYTGRDLIIKFTGCYHGHGDSLLVKAGSGGATFGVPDSAGVPAALAQHTISLPYNDLTQVEQALAAHDRQIAAIIVEPVAGNMGVVPPAEGFLAGLRTLCDATGTVLIFDEVMTGFRVAWGGAQTLYNVTPDITVLGKIVGGGMPLAAYGGKRAIMEQISPLGPIYQAGTLSGNPLCVTAGLVTLSELSTHPEFYSKLEEYGQRIETHFNTTCQRLGLPAHAQRVGSMLTFFFSEEPVADFAAANRCNLSAFAVFFQGMLNQGIYLPPSQFESCFLNTALSSSAIETICTACTSILEEMACQ